jgi:hypothetical protein
VPTLRTKITIEDREVVIVRKRHYVVRGHCSRCGREVSMVTPRHAALLTFCDLETMSVLMQTGKVHPFSNGTEKPLVCLNSLCWL